MSRARTKSASPNPACDEPDKAVPEEINSANIENDVHCFLADKEVVGEVFVKESDNKCEEDCIETDLHGVDHSNLSCPNETDTAFRCDVLSSNIECCDINMGADKPLDTVQRTNKSESVTTVEGGEISERDRALVARKQPLMELVSSEEGYVRRLRMVKEHYIPLVSIQHRTQTSDSLISIASNANSLKDFTPTQQLHPPPTVPDDLAARWRIVWGNWVQLYEWHSNFLERLSALVETEPDQIPKQFIDARARLRTNYSKYCENHRKAALIAEQYRDYFEELRLYLGDKEDVVSYLMQPVQRIMRYQLPISEILKYTRRANLPELAVWQKALDIMKEIPKDTQLILEAARIDGFPGVITALGNILIRGDLLVATTSHEQLLDLVTAYKLTLQDLHSTSAGNSHSSASAASSPPMASPDSPPDNNNTSSSSSGVTNLALANPLPSAGIPTTPAPAFESAASPEFESAGANSLPTGPPVGLFTGNLKFAEVRVFLFEQMLLVTEEAKPKRRMLDTYAQSTYQFRAAINVNKMRYESHWYNFSLPNGHTNADAAAVDYLLSTGIAPDDLRFAVLDQTHNRTVAYIMDPVSSVNREAWVVQLRDIQRMQNELLLALQDPRRFNTGNRGDCWSNDIPWSAGSRCNSSRSDAIQLITPSPPPPPTTPTQLTTAAPAQSQHHQGHQQQRQRKWPSLTVRRPGRLSSSSSGSGCPGQQQNAQSFSEMKPDERQSPQQRAYSGQASSHFQRNKQQSGSRGGQKQLWNKGVTRSLSAERQPINVAGSSANSSKGSGNTMQSPDAIDSKSGKCSLSAEASFRASNAVFDNDSPVSETPKGAGGSVGKKRNMFTSLFSRNKSRQRAKNHQPQTATQLTSSAPSSAQSTRSQLVSPPATAWVTASGTPPPAAVEASPPSAVGEEKGLLGDERAGSPDGED